MKWLSIFVLFFTFCTGCNEKKSSEKTYRVLVSPDNPPFEFKQTAQEGSLVVGFDIDVIKKIGEFLNKPIQIIEMDFQGLVPSIQSNRGDMSISAFALTKARAESVDFSIPYYAYTFALVMRSEDEKTIYSEHNLKDKTLGVQLGSAHEVLANDLRNRVSGLKIKTLSKVGELVQELKNKRIDAILIESFTAKEICQATTGLFDRPLPFNGENLHIIFPKGSPLKKEVDGVIKKMQQNGEMDKLISKWFKN